MIYCFKNLYHFGRPMKWAVVHPSLMWNLADLVSPTAAPADPGDTGTTGTPGSHRNLFSLSYPLGKGCGPSFEQTWFPITQECFMLNLVEIVKKFPRRWFLNAVCVFSPFHYYHSLIEKGWCVALHFNVLKPHLLRMFCTKFGWKWPTGSEEEDGNVKRL